MFITQVTFNAYNHRNTNCICYDVLLYCTGLPELQTLKFHLSHDPKSLI
jgi:hypothetical protein